MKEMNDCCQFWKCMAHKKFIFWNHFFAFILGYDTVVYAEALELMPVTAFCLKVIFKSEIFMNWPLSIFNIWKIKQQRRHNIWQCWDNFG